MPNIDHAAKTVRTVCVSDDEAKARVILQEMLDNNPGYTPVLVVEDAAGKETTYTSLKAPTRRRSTAASTAEDGDDDVDVDVDVDVETET